MPPFIRLVFPLLNYSTQTTAASQRARRVRKKRAHPTASLNEQDLTATLLTVSNRRWGAVLCSLKFERGVHTPSFYLVGARLNAAMLSPAHRCSQAACLWANDSTVFLGSYGNLGRVPGGTREQWGLWVVLRNHLYKGRKMHTKMRPEDSNPPLL